VITTQPLRGSGGRITVPTQSAFPIVFIRLLPRRMGAEFGGRIGKKGLDDRGI
jgi:hypothetical protein